MNRLFRAAGLAAAAFLSIGANGNWNAAVVETDRGHQIGNPQAAVHLTEFVSYTCPHCATFALEGEARLQYAYINSGKLRFEVRPIIRNAVDLTISMMVRCGDPGKFIRNHTMFMINQRTWLPLAQRPTAGQRQRWTLVDGPTARRSMASDLGFYALMETRGYTRTELDRCLSDQAEADRLTANTTADFAEFGITGTPSFAINGETLPDAHDWKSLEQHLNAHF